MELEFLGVRKIRCGRFQPRDISTVTKLGLEVASGALQMRYKHVQIQVKMVTLVFLC